MSQNIIIKTNGTQIPENEDDFNSLSASLCTDHHYVSWGRHYDRSIGDNVDITLVYNGLPAENIMSMHMQDGAVDRNRKDYEHVYMQDFGEFREQMESFTGESEIELSRQLVRVECEGDTVKRKFNRNEFIKPYGVLVPVYGEAEDYSIFAKKEMKFVKGLEKQVPIIIRRMDKYQNKIIHYEHRDYTRFFEIDSQSIINRFMQTPSYTDTRRVEQAAHQL